MLNLETLKNELNPQQYKAVTTTEGAILIIAGAGSGKTRVITFRIAHMLDKGIPQSQILALTFTNKAAKEMADRIKSLTQKKLQNLTVSTFHAFGVKVLRADIDKLGYRDNFSIYDETDRVSLIKECGRELKFSPEAMDIYMIGNLISNIKTGRKNWDTSNDMYRPLYESYQEGLKLFNAVDFDDLIVLPIKLFKEHPEVLAKYRERYKYIMVDEFQDTSHQQYEFMHLLADKNVAVVGDDDQSIYSWRGADYQNIINFEHDFDVTAFGYAPGYMCTGMNSDKPTLFHANDTLQKLFDKSAVSIVNASQVKNGIIASGDKFISDAKTRKYLATQFNATATEMEGAAIAQASSANTVPFMIVRMISDLADGKPNEEYNSFEQNASAVLANVVLKSIEMYE